MRELKNKYQIIYMDPPWQYGGSGGSKWLRSDNFYETIPDKELSIKLEKSIKPLIDEKNCLIFVWVTGPHLQKSINLICKSLDVKYITVGFTWYKERANVGNYTMSSCEYCLIFKKGKIPSDRIRNPGIMQFLSKPISKHSEKPFEIRNRIVQMFPKSDKLEVFARHLTPGFDVIGQHFGVEI